MTIKFQADNDLNQFIVSVVARRQPEVDFQTASMAGLHGLSDPEVLVLAARDGRILVTHDLKTMSDHFALFIVEQLSPGVIMVPQRLPVGESVDDLLLIWSASLAEEWQNRIASLPL
jgi:predicted nuclease of predicted toxin-antitoxin system